MFKTSRLLLLIATLSLVLPNPSYAVTTVTANGTVIVNNTSFTNGVPEDGLNYKALFTLYQSKELMFNATMQVAPIDVGKQADTLLIVGIEPDAPFDGGIDTKYFAYTSQGQSIPIDVYASPEDVWKAVLANPYRANVKLLPKLSFYNLGKFKFDKAAMYYVFIGYRLLKEGTIVYNSVPIAVDVTSAGIH